MKFFKFRLSIVFAAVLWSIPFFAGAFSDLPESHRNAFAITYLNNEGVIQGYPDGTVRPDALINRAELLKLLIEGLDTQQGEIDAMKDADCFPDVHDQWYVPYVCLAKEKGWIAGYPDGTFKPNNPVRKTEALKIILNAFSIEAADPTAPATKLFDDIPEDAWYRFFLQTAVEQNLLDEIGGKIFQPGLERARGEVAQMIARIMQMRFIGDKKYTEELGAEFQTLFLMNKFRAENGGLKPLKFNPLLIKVAREHSKDMALVIGDMSHDGSDGSQASERIRAAGVPGNLGTGENVGRGVTSSARSIFKAVSDVHYNIFMPEPDDECNHRTTILSKCLPFSEVGVGVYVKDNLMYFTEDFISIH